MLYRLGLGVVTINMGKIDKLIERMVEKSLGVDDEETVDGGIRIVILQRGWVFVGRFYQSGSDCVLEDGFNIRVWGTTKGLGEIASDGPTSSTKLDKIPTTRFHELTVIATLDCDEKIWKKHLS